MATSANDTKVFISYSWSPIKNKQKVMELAERLSNDGIYVIIDEWNLQPGQDKYHFMEQMVTDPDVKKVLLVCNKEYSEKANYKKGGVGIESLIISGDIYSQAEQTKFIPVVFELDNKGEPYLPAFVKSRRYIDLITEDGYEDSYEHLLRTILDRPAHKRPPIGYIPSYLEEDKAIFLPTAHKVKTIRNSFIQEKKNVSVLIKDYFESFIKAVEYYDFKEEDDIDEHNFIKKIEDKIDDLIVLRNDFIDFIDVYCTYAIDFDVDILHGFFEKLLEYHFERADYYPSNSLGDLKFDSRKFFYYELFLTVVAIMLKRERYKELAYILQNSFVISKGGKIEAFSFINFRFTVDTLNVYKNDKYGLKRVSVTADKMKSRTSDKLKFENLVDADILLYYISLIFVHPQYDYLIWFPETSCYYHFNRVILPKSISERYFDKIKILFSVNSKEELTQKINQIELSGKDSVPRNYFNIPLIRKGLNVDKICTIK